MARRNTAGIINDLLALDDDVKLGDRLSYIRELVVDHKYNIEHACLGFPSISVGASTKSLFTNKAGVAFTCGEGGYVYYSIAGRQFAFTATTHDIATGAVVKEACYLFSLTSNYTPRVTMGDVASGSGKAEWPTCLSTRTPIGGVRIAIDASANTIFDATTTTMGASQISAVTCYNFAFFNADAVFEREIPTAFDSAPTGSGEA